MMSGRSRARSIWATYSAVREALCRCGEPKALQSASSASIRAVAATSASDGSTVVGSGSRSSLAASGSSAQSAAKRARASARSARPAVCAHSVVHHDVQQRGVVRWRCLVGEGEHVVEVVGAPEDLLRARARSPCRWTSCGQVGRPPRRACRPTRGPGDVPARRRGWFRRRIRRSALPRRRAR